MRDHRGMFVGGSCHFFFPSVADPEHAELLACRRGVQLVIEVGARRTVLETDNLGIKQALSSQELARSRYGPLIEEIKELLASQDEFRVNWARRSANRTAHNLARDGCLNKSCKA